MNLLHYLPGLTTTLKSIIPSVTYFFGLNFYKKFHIPMKENVKDNIFNSHYNVIKSGIVNIFVVYPLYILTESEIENITLFNILLGIFLIDTVEYFFHYSYHKNKLLFKYVHSLHHNINLDPSISFTNNTLEPPITSSAILFSIMYSNISYNEYLIILSLTFLATISEHTNTNPKKFHYIHHHVNKKYNFQQPYFTFWDHIFGTYYKGTNLKIPFVP